jgi:predicted DNA-binding protein (MmcQ/YjbR family)
MSCDWLRTRCLALPGVEEDQPFGPEVWVWKAGGKLFALANPDDHPVEVNLKCDPDLALELRDRHECVRPGYHMNRRHWNTVTLDGSVPLAVVDGWIRHSYELVIAGLPKCARLELQAALERIAREGGEGKPG